ncbi:T9SS type A sorting domain-containing protein [bacterium]|nr:MAG: T9SS type A sorting domain-containing protein [bacterium]
MFKSNAFSILFKLVFSLGFVVQVSAQSASVTFRVNMSNSIRQGLFDEKTEFVDVAGSFNNWGNTLLKLTKGENDSIYYRTVTGFTVGQSFEFKFRINGQWLGREEFSGGGDNRKFTVSKTQDSLLVWYNDEEPKIGPPISSFSALTTDLVVGQQIVFTNTSSGNIDSFQWDFEGGIPATSTEKNPLVAYPQAGTYSVRLIASNEGGEADTLLMEEYISVSNTKESLAKWWNDRVFYEIFVRSFYDSDGDGIGDINGIIEKLDYLNDGDPNTKDDLGIGGIWLMPVNPSPSYHGYDVTNYKEINPQYGTLDDFKRLVQEAHNRGIAIIIDYVMNHTSTEHPWFQQSKNNNPTYRDYYVWSATNPATVGPWGQDVWHSSNGSYYYGIFWGGMPDLNYSNEAVKDSMFDAASFWINETGVDGFRLDAVKYIFEDGSIMEDLPATHEFFGDFSAHIKQDNPDVFTVGEAWTSTEKVLEYVIPNRIDYCFEFDVAESILQSVLDANTTSMRKAFTNAYYSYPDKQFGVFLTNHDQNRVNNVLLDSIPMNKVAASMYLTLPGVPYLYYGEEIGMSGLKPDEYIRTPMMWNASSNAGFTTGNPWLRVNSEYSKKNVASLSDDSNSLFSHYRNLIQARNTFAELRRGNFTFFPTDDDEIVVYSRSTQVSNVDSTLMVLINVSSNSMYDAVIHPIGIDTEILNYQLEDVITGKKINLVSNGDGSYSLPVLEAYETIIARAVPITVAIEPPQKASRFELYQAYPNPFNPSTTLSFHLDKASDVRLCVYDALGREVQRLLQEPMQAGFHKITFDASTLASGVYMYQLRTASGVLTQKMTLLK